MSIGTLTSKGQITIPNQVRKHLGLRTGDRIEFRPQPDGTVILRPLVCRTDEVFGCLSGHRRRSAVSVEDMDRLSADSFRQVR